MLEAELKINANQTVINKKVGFYLAWSEVQAQTQYSNGKENEIKMKQKWMEKQIKGVKFNK